MEQQINKSQRDNKPNKNSLNAELFIIAGFICFLLVIAVAGVYFFQEKQKNELKIEINSLKNRIFILQKQISDLQSPETQIPAAEPFSDISVNSTKEQEKEPLIVKISGEILWGSPAEIPSLKIFKEISGYSREEEAKYYKVGEFVGDYPQKGDVILVSASYEGPAFYPGFYRFVKDKETGEIILLKKYSDELYQNDGFNRAKFSVDETYAAPSLEFPESFGGPNPRQVLKIDKGVNKFFESQNLRKVFTDKKLGDVYTTADYPSSFSDVFSRHGFYVEASDGTVKVYSFKIDFIGENNAPEIVWNDGTENLDGYASADITGCGSADYISAVSKDIVDANKDLEPAGKNSKGDIIYELKNINHKLLKDFYENKYWVPKGENKTPYEEFAKGHILFFWTDPFGRLIKFENNKFVSPVKCAKPVIYLYPEKTAEISVKIEPKGGMSYSDPFYNNSWTIRADSAGNLTDLDSGKTYPYLFWEGRGGVYEQPQKGFAVAKEDIHNFLAEKLGKFGLNEKEISDFLAFWEPKMKESPYYFITFLGNREMEQIAPLDIEPKPDTVIRVLMDFSPLDKLADFKGFEIKTPERKGFTVVEWGGVLR